MIEPERGKRSPWGKLFVLLVFIVAGGGYFWLTSEETQAPTVNEPSGVDFDISQKNEDEASRIKRSDYERPDLDSNPVDSEMTDEELEKLQNELKESGVESDSIITDTDESVDVPQDEPSSVAEAMADQEEPQNSSGNVTVLTPAINESLTSPVTITGEAKANDGNVTIRVKTKEGTALISETARVQAAAGEVGPFKITIHYQFSNTKEGFIEVGDGVDIVRIPVSF